LGRTRSRKPHNNNSKLNNKNSCWTWRKMNNKKFRKPNINNKSKANNKNITNLESTRRWRSVRITWESFTNLENAGRW
jgi:hypothetical protein